MSDKTITKIKIMTVGASNQLIKNLEAENLTASEADRAFNLKWIQLLREAQAKAIEAKFAKGFKEIFKLTKS